MVTGVVGAIHAWCGLDPTSDAGRIRLFKTAALAHFMAQEKRGSGADVAAVVHGGLLAYRNPGLGDLLRSVDAATGMPGLVDRIWLELRTETLPWPEGWSLVSASTGRGASTRELLDRLQGLEGPAAEEYARLRAGLSDLAMKGIESPTGARLAEASTGHQDALDRFEVAVGGAGIVTAPLERAIGIARDLRAGVKVSGAGGGDSVVAWVPTGGASTLVDAWEAAGLPTLRVDEPVPGLELVDR